MRKKTVAPARFADRHRGFVESSAINERNNPITHAHPPSQSSAPTIIAEWNRSASERVRISLGTFQQRETVDIRIWWQDGSVYRPGRKGITLGIKHLAQLSAGLAQALSLTELAAQRGDKGQ